MGRFGTLKDGKIMLDWGRLSAFCGLLHRRVAYDL